MLPDAEQGHVLARLARDHGQEVDHVLRLAGEELAQLGILGGDADRAGVLVAGAHHDAAEHNQGGGCEPELLGAEQRRDDHVAPGLELTVGLQPDAAAKAVQHQGLLGLRQPQLPGHARVADRGEGSGPGAAVIAADEYHVRMALGHAGCDRADADLGHQLDRDAGLGVGAS